MEPGADVTCYLKRSGDLFQKMDTLPAAHIRQTDPPLSGEHLWTHPRHVVTSARRGAAKEEVLRAEV